MQLVWIVSAVTVMLAPRPTGGGPTSLAVGDRAVAIRAFGYQPKQLEIPPGTRVVWTNQDEIEHTVTAVADSGAEPSFAGALAGKGQSFGFTFDRAGTFSYFCARHTFMRGAIRVSLKGDR